jgi:ribonuclease HI
MIFSDGGARGNPGPAAIAFIIQSEGGQGLKTASHYIGQCTNNQAEYRALIAALLAADSLNADKVFCHLDSELVTKQLTGEYKVKNQELKQLWRKVQELKKHFKEVRFVNVPRTCSQIQEADRLVNRILDASNRR